MPLLIFLSKLSISSPDGFSRCTNSKDEGGYYHPLFLRGRKRLCRFMKRVRKASGSDQRSKGSTPDPDFYAMPSL